MATLAYQEESDFEADCAMSDDSFAFDEESDFEMEPVAVKAKKSKSNTKENAPKKTAKKGGSKKKVAFDDSSDEEEGRAVLGEKSLNKDTNKTSKSTGKKTVEEIYQKKTQLEHILLRPDTYIGSVERISQEMFILQESMDGENSIVEKKIEYTPGLYKIYDEILVNAADNKQRDPNMDSMEITISKEANEISVKNNGNGIPVAMHKEHKCYVPTLIFGHLLTGSNFDDNEKKTTGGRNGYGAKLANIFSTKFIVECVDTKAKLKFHQVFRDNMSVAETPTVKKITAAEAKKGDYVKITFSPDLTRFKMSELDDDTVALLSKRAYDIQGSMANRAGKKLSVKLNGKKLPVKNFQSYLKLYKGIEPPAAYERADERWEVGVGVSDGSFQQISFVNAICTSKGGQHVNYIADMIAKKVAAVVKKKNKGGIEIKENQIKNHLCISVNCLIENPAFDSQTKENLTSRKNSFGSTCKLSDKFIKQVEKSGVVENILSFAKFKQKQAMEKTSGKKKRKLTGIPKLDDANFAGSAKSKDCTLILTEGDSAKSLAMAGLSVVGRDYYGCFPLKGKPLNVREATHSQIQKNEEINNVIQIMGLKHGVVYDETNIKTLRYGHLMIMADQDHDGSHIKGLIINFIHHFWPSLLNIPGFLQQFITPIVKATKNKKSETFFTLPEYEAWKESTGNDAKGWKIKYYKGLGTSTSAEGKEYFSNLGTHEVAFETIDDDSCACPLTVVDSDSEMSDDDSPKKQSSGSELITMAFGKKYVEDRKRWLNNMKKDTFLNYSKNEGVKYSDFINRELILFSHSDNARSIPNIFDGFKPSQRKVLFACFLRKLTSDAKVGQLSGYIGEKAAYHHGEVSLQGTIVNMAQDFVGSNNVNLLTPSGQFGTRRMGGKDAASARYIFTRLEKLTRTIFHPDDDALLNYLNDDGQSIEPEYYMPVIPTILVNGSEGIGTGWSTNIPNYNPREVISNIRLLIDGEGMKEMKPHYFGYKGTIEPVENKLGSYTVTGEIERTDDTTLVITELPLKKWTADYKGFLEGMLESKKKNEEADLKDFTEGHTDTTVLFTITATKEKIDSFEKEKGGLLKKFKLTSTLNTTNMNLFDEAGRIIRYSSPLNILQKFYEKRLDFYDKRKEHLLKNLRREQEMLSNKARFVEEVCNGDLIVSNRKRSEILNELKGCGYSLFPKDNDKRMGSAENEEEDTDENESESDAVLGKGYEYLLGMKIWSLTLERAKKLKSELEEKTQMVSELQATPLSALWKRDLSAIEEALDNRDEYYANAAKKELKAQGMNKQRRGGKKTATKKKKKADDLDGDFAPSKPKTKSTKTKPKKKEATKPINKQKVEPKKVEPVSIAPPEVYEVDSDSEPESTSLLERMKNKLVVSPPPKKSTKSRALVSKKPTSRGSKKRPSPREASSDDASELDVFDTDTYKPAALTPAPKKSRTVKGKISKEIHLEESDHDDIFDQDEKAQPAVDLLEDSEEEFDEDIAVDDSEDDYVPPPRERRTRGKPTKSYTFDLDDDSDSDF